MGLGNLGDLGNLDLGQLQQLVPNVNFPADKDQVLSDLQSNDAPQEVVDQVRNSSQDTFNSALGLAILATGIPVYFLWSKGDDAV